jgi:hypothetical protein
MSIERLLASALRASQGCAEMIGFRASSESGRLPLRAALALAIHDRAATDRLRCEAADRLVLHVADDGAVHVERVARSREAA